MAAINRIVSCLLLLLFVVSSIGNVCERKICKCSTKDGKLKVDCRSNGITEIYSQNQFPKDMQILDLSRNNISIVKKGFLDLQFKLKRLYLQSNSIKRLEERAFVGLGDLEQLKIRRNKLVRLEDKAFLGLTKLKNLDLRDNRISSINKRAFYGLRSLSKLHLENNSFTTISNGTFDELTALRRLNMKAVPIRCDCKLNFFVAFLTKSPSNLKVVGTCHKSQESLVTLKGTNLCEKPQEVVINPSENQIVSVGDSFHITCRTATKRKQSLYWRKNKNTLPKHVTPISHFDGKMAITLLKFTSIRWQDGGTYMCYIDDRIISKEIAIHVVTSKTDMCSRDATKIGHDHFLWPVTIERSTAIAPCPWPNDRGARTNIRRTCTERGVWGQVNFGDCKLVSLYSKLSLLSQLLKKNDFTDVAGVAEQLKLLTDASSYQTAENITLAFDVFAGIIRKNIPFTGKLLDDMLESFNNMMDVKDGTLYSAEWNDQTPSRLAAHLELISREIINKTTSHALSNIVIGSVKKIQSKENKTCKVFFETGVRPRPGGVYCETNKRRDYYVAINIPGTILQSLQAAGHTMNDLKLQFLIYRNAKFFPNVISSKTEETMRHRNVSSSVLAIQMANMEELNLTDPLVIQFATQPGTEPIVGHFDFGEDGKQWSVSTDCVVKDSTYSITTVECRRLVNKNLAIMSHLRSENSTSILNDVVYPVEIVVYVGAVVTSLLLIATMNTFALARTVRFNRDDIIMLMNACLALLVVVLSFAFGIDRTENAVLCRTMGMCLHFFFFASLLWLGSYVVCLTRRLMPRQKEASEEVFNPVLMYYMVSWGVPAIICGMTIAGNITNYKATDYCWLTESAGLGAFVGPACLLFIINAVLLVRLHLLLARGIMDRRPSEENTEEERLQTDEPIAIVEATDPNEGQNAEKSAITLHLVATWVVMSLIYLNFILAYFLVNSRTSKLRWIFLSYIYALANIALGAAIFGFHCVARPEVRKVWKFAWKQVRETKIRCGPCQTLWKATRRKQNTYHMNGRILVNGQDVTQRLESDRQSNITLPSSAALTNDVFFNGRPMSSARLSLLDEADFPPEETPNAGAVDNEVDITETANSEDNRRSQSSVHSERKSKVHGESVSELSPTIPEVSEENQNMPPIPSEETHEDNADITDGMTSKSESSAPTAIEVPQAPVRPDSPIVEHPHVGPHPGMMRPFLSNGGRPPSNPVVHPHPPHQLRPVYQAPFAHQAVPANHIPPAHHVPLANQQPPAHYVLPAGEGPSSNHVPPAHHVTEPPPPSYQKCMEIASQSSSSIGDNSALSRSNSRRKRSSESLGSRNECGSVGARSRKQLQAQPSSSSAISEVPGPVSSRPSDSANSRIAAQSLGASNPRSQSRYRDGRLKPEPKQWSRPTRNRIAYVPIPHVSKIHREPVHNETSV